MASTAGLSVGIVILTLIILWMIVFTVITIITRKELFYRMSIVGPVGTAMHKLINDVKYKDHGFMYYIGTQFTKDGSKEPINEPLNASLDEQRVTGGYDYKYSNNYSANSYTPNTYKGTYDPLYA